MSSLLTRDAQYKLPRPLFCALPKRGHSHRQCPPIFAPQVRIGEFQPRALQGARAKAPETALSPHFCWQALRNTLLAPPAELGQLKRFKDGTDLS